MSWDFELEKRHDAHRAILRKPSATIRKDMYRRGRRTVRNPGYRSFELQDLEQEVRVPTSGFTARFDASLDRVGAYQAEREAADHRHVFCAGAIARLVILEFGIEQSSRRCWMRHIRRGRGP